MDILSPTKNLKGKYITFRIQHNMSKLPIAKLHCFFPSAQNYPSVLGEQKPHPKGFSCVSGAVHTAHVARFPSPSPRQAAKPQKLEITVLGPT